MGPLFLLADLKEKSYFKAVKNRWLYLVLLGVALTIPGVLLPWYLGADVSVTGFQGKMGNPGWLLLILALLRVGAVYLPGKYRSWVATASTGLFAYFVLDAWKTVIRLESAGPGIGLFLLLVATVTFCLPARPFFR